MGGERDPSYLYLDRNHDHPSSCRDRKPPCLESLVASEDALLELNGEVDGGHGRLGALIELSLRSTVF
nr:hypothetical protein Iba_chr10cCG6780 [Ipomoea batatas]GMD45211.1 hypothetical protein Iba_chr10dCG7850 [Ipomoea batatas]